VLAVAVGREACSRIEARRAARDHIGLVLMLTHLIGIPVTNTSVNPARSTGVAVYAGGWALGQLWLFWIAPIAGGLLGGLIHRWLRAEEVPTSEAHGRAPLPQR
jgi:aquaporin Z